MRAFTLAIIAITATAWDLNAYKSHQKAAAHYAPIEKVDLDDDHEGHTGYGPAYTESTEIETVNDKILWNKLRTSQGVETYTHAHHGTDASDDHPNSHHVYPGEHSHHREIEYQERHPVIVNQERKVYHVTPTRYTRSYDEAAEDEHHAYQPDIFFPTTVEDHLHSDAHKKAHSGHEQGVDTTLSGVVHDFNSK